MHKTIDAIYKNGKIVPLEELALEEETKLLVTVMDKPKRENSGWKQLRGKYKGCLSNVDEFITRKKLEKQLEL